MSVEIGQSTQNLAHALRTETRPSPTSEPSRVSVLYATASDFAAMLPKLRDELGAETFFETLLADLVIQAVVRLRQFAAAAESETGVEEKRVRSEGHVYDAMMDAYKDLRRERDRREDAARKRPATRANEPSMDRVAPLAAREVSTIDPAAIPRIDEEARAASDDWRSRLAIDPMVSQTSPVVRGTWVTAQRICSLVIDNWTWADLLRTHPELTEDDIRSCLAYSVEQENREYPA